MKNIFEALSQIGLIPVITIDRAEDAVPLARALLDGGVGCAEITFRTTAAAEAIRRMIGEVREMLVGAGTVLTVQQVMQVRRIAVDPGRHAVFLRDQPGTIYAARQILSDDVLE